MAERKGLWTPPHVLDLVRDGLVDHTDALILGVVVYYESHGHYGCRVTNEWFATTLCIDVRNVSRRLKKLREKGYITSTKKGKRRAMKTAGGAASPPSPPEEAQQDEGRVRPQKARDEGRVRPRNKEVSIDTSFGKAEQGFGLIQKEVKSTTTEFDLNIATQLLNAVKTQPPGKTWIRSAKPKTWPKHITTLRKRDGATEGQITTAMDWYAAHIGEEFVPVAYSAAAFRKKFPAILRQAERVSEETTLPGPLASKIAERFKGSGWPKGSAAKLGGAVQVNLDRYKTWRSELAEFLERVARDDLAHEYDATHRKRRRKAGKVLLERMPGADTYARLWVERVFKRVRGWQDWSGDFAPFLFNPNSKETKALCQTALQGHYGEAAGAKEWDKLVDMMNNESN